mgnify:CR=1 FL=1
MNDGSVKTSRNAADRALHASHWAANWARIGWFGIRRRPFRMLADMRRYPWMWNILQANRLLDMMVHSRSGPYAGANAVVISNIVKDILRMIDGFLERPDSLVLHEDLVPPEILYGMGLTPWMAEFLGIVLPLVSNTFMEQYIDEAENNGIPADVCSLPKSTMGLVLRDEMPVPAAMLTSNMPCDGGMSSYTLMEKRMDVPTFRLDIPFNFYNERAVRYFAGELDRIIAWLERHTPGRMDWDRLRKVCEERNRFVELETELWDILRTRPAPMAGEPIYLMHLMYGICNPGLPRGTDVVRRVLDLAKKNRAAGRGAINDERYRVVLWNPPTIIFPDLFVWAERAYGVVMVMDMLTYNRHPYIDTSTPESMLRGLAQVIMQGPMARHTRGPAENFFGDLFSLYNHFDLDMIWMAGHIGCKNTQALMGMFREKCRERKIPLLNINYDLSDTRIVSPENMRRQIEQFMETVMDAERLDAAGKVDNG